MCIDVEDGLMCDIQRDAEDWNAGIEDYLCCFWVNVYIEF